MTVAHDGGNQEADPPDSAAEPMLLVSVWFDMPGRAGFRARVSATTANSSPNASP